MKKRIVTILSIFILMTVCVLSASAETLTPEAIASLKEEYAEAHVVLDVYCLGIYNGSGYELTPAYQGLDLSDTDFTDSDSIDALAQKAANMTFTDGSQAVPAIEAAQLDVKIDNLLLGLYLITPHGSDLSRSQYVKRIKTQDGAEKLVTIAQTNTFEYRFSPVLLIMNYNNVDAETEIKAERIERYGRLRINKTVTAYNSAHPVSFVFEITGKNEEGEVVFNDVAGLTLDGTGAGYVDIDRIPVGTIVTVTEVYTGSDLSYVSGPTPENVVIEPDEIAEISIGSGEELPEPKQKVGFVNNYNYEEQHGSGITNRFRFDGTTWQWFKDGVLQTP